jgi:hypothetical protein
MATTTQQAPASKVMYWAGWVLSILPSLFLLFNGVKSLLQPNSEDARAALEHLGYTSPDVGIVLGIIMIVCTLIYLIPQTSILGAILLTGYLGGAVASHVRAQDSPFFIAFPIIFSVIFWLGIWLRCGRLRAIVPFRT